MLLKPLSDEVRTELGRAADPEIGCWPRSLCRMRRRVKRLTELALDALQGSVERFYARARVDRQAFPPLLSEVVVAEHWAIE